MICHYSGSVLAGKPVVNLLHTKLRTASELLTLLLVLLAVFAMTGSAQARQSSLAPIHVAYTEAGTGELWIADGYGRRRFVHATVTWWHKGFGTPGLFSTPAWSPDGSKLAYFRWASPAGKVLIVDDLRRQRALTKPLRGRAAPDLSTSPPQAPLWSPDGSRIAFIRSDANVEIADVAARRSRTIRTSGLAGDWYGIRLAWAPDGSEITVTIEPGGRAVGTWIADLRGQLRRFAPGGTRVLDPAWSPDGTKIAYSQRDGHGNAQIMIANVLGDRTVRVTNDVPLDPTTHFDNRDPVWSPDGSAIAFLSNRDGIYDTELFLVGADGRRERRLTRGIYVTSPFAGYAGGQREPALWSPDGRRLAFRGWSWYRSGRIGLVAASGRGLEKLMREPPDSAGYVAPSDFAWRPSARRPRPLPQPTPLPSAPPVHRISVPRNHLPVGAAKIVRIYPLMRLRIDPARGPDRPVELAPDGSALSFIVTSDTHRFEVGVLDLRGRSRRIVARGATNPGLSPGGIFSPDGRRLLFRKWAELWSVDLATGRLERVADRAGPGPFFWLKSGRVAYLDPRGELMLVRPGQAPASAHVRIANREAYAVSPNGTLLLVSEGCRGVLIDLRTRRRRRLGDDLFPNSTSWAPTGGTFVLDRPAGSCAPPLGAGAGDELLFRRRGGEVGALFGVREANVQGVALSWSPHGRWLLATVSYGGTRPPRSPVYALSARSGRVTRVIRGLDWGAWVFAGPRNRILFTRSLGLYTRELLSGQLASG